MRAFAALQSYVLLGLSVDPRQDTGRAAVIITMGNSREVIVVAREKAVETLLPELRAYARDCLADWRNTPASGFKSLVQSLSEQSTGVFRTLEVGEKSADEIESIIESLENPWELGT